MVRARDLNRSADRKRSGVAAIRVGGGAGARAVSSLAQIDIGAILIDEVRGELRAPRENLDAGADGRLVRRSPR